MATEQFEVLSRCLRQPKTYIILYQTHSKSPIENESVVESAASIINDHHKEYVKKKQSSIKGIHLERLNEVLFKLDPINDLVKCECCDDVNCTSENVFFHLEPTKYGSGCFIALLKRTGKVKLDARRVIEDAESQGLFDLLEHKIREAARPKRLTPKESRLSRLATPTQSFLIKTELTKLAHPNIITYKSKVSQASNVTPIFLKLERPSQRHCRCNHRDSDDEYGRKFVARPAPNKILSRRIAECNLPKIYGRNYVVGRTYQRLVPTPNSTANQTILRSQVKRDKHERQEKTIYPMHTIDFSELVYYN